MTRSQQSGGILGDSRTLPFVNLLANITAVFSVTCHMYSDTALLLEHSVFLTQDNQCEDRITACCDNILVQVPYPSCQSQCCWTLNPAKTLLAHDFQLHDARSHIFRPTWTRVKPVEHWTGGLLMWALLPVPTHPGWIVTAWLHHPARTYDIAM